MEKKVADLRSHEECQARLGLTEEAVKSYEKAYKAGKSLPALEVFEVDGELIIVDGFHRLEAAKRAKVATLPVELVGRGTMAEAEWAALGKNHNHGVRRTREDKRKAVQMALGNEAAAKLSNRKLAEYLEVSHTFVSNERKMFEVMGGNVASPEVEWARKMLADNAAYWIEDCKKNVRLSESPDRHNIDGPLTVPADAQWIRLNIILNRSRHKIERQGGYHWAHINMTHVAGLIARAAGCEPWDGFWKQIADGFSNDDDLVFDDTHTFDLKTGKRVEYKWGDDPKRDAHKRVIDQISIDELKELAPHRHVVRRSESEWPDYSHRSDGDPAPVGDEWLALKEQAEAHP